MEAVLCKLSSLRRPYKWLHWRSCVKRNRCLATKHYPQYIFTCISHENAEVMTTLFSDFERLRNRLSNLNHVIPNAHYAHASKWQFTRMLRGGSLIPLMFCPFSQLLLLRWLPLTSEIVSLLTSHTAGGVPIVVCSRLCIQNILRKLDVVFGCCENSNVFPGLHRRQGILWWATVKKGELFS